MPSNVVLETDGLTVRFGGVVAVDHVRFKLAERELRCLIGPNGAGKSTFFKCLTGVLKPSEGRVWLREERIDAMEPHAIARRGVGIKTQVPSLMDGLSVRENVWLAARRNHSVKRARVLAGEILTRLGIEAVANSAAGALAHGQRQMVELGVVLAGEPWLVLLDEPAAGMTQDEVERMAEVIREINQTATVVAVEHDMKFVGMVARRVTVFHQGAVLAEGDTQAVLSDPRVQDVYIGRKAK